MQWGRYIKFFIAGAIFRILVPISFPVECVLLLPTLAVLWLSSRHSVHRCPANVPAWERYGSLLLLRPWCLIRGHIFEHFTRADAAAMFECGVTGVECGWCGYIEHNWLSLVEGADTECSG